MISMSLRVQIYKNVRKLRGTRYMVVGAMKHHASKGEAFHSHS